MSATPLATRQSDPIAALERKLAAQCKINAVLTSRIERHDASLGNAGSMIEQNLILERVVANKTRELESERHELRRALRELQDAQTLLLQAQKMESIGQLAAGMAHEINTPIQYVTDNITFVQRCFDPVLAIAESVGELLGTWRRGELDEAAVVACEGKLARLKFDYMKRNVPAALEQSLEGLHRVATIVAAMKDFSHPSTGVKDAVDLGEVINVSTTVARNEWKYVADLEIAISPDLPPVPCLRDEIGQVILNLIVNAAHAIGDAVKDTGSKGLIRVTAGVVGNCAEVRIQDSGTGIPEQARARVFDPFFTTKPVGKGTGQGLAISYVTVVEKHQGKIFFETETGRGTTFIIQLPLTVAAA
jgi:signal transduction histidine kinase